MNVGDLRRAAAALPPGTSITIPRDALLEVLGPEPIAPPVRIEAPDRLLTAREVARRLAVAPRWVYAHAGTLPFTRRIGTRVLRFSERGLERHLARTGGHL